MKGYIHSTESFGTVDGPGVRFVVFMQGCPMRCLYCHNPDTWETGKGTECSVFEVLEQFYSCRQFYHSGGITVTGGEPLMQIGFVTELFEAAKERDIHTCLDTSGICFDPDNAGKIEEYKKLCEVTDIFMLDIKHIDDAVHKKLTGHSNRNILAFAKFLKDNARELWVRHVVVPGLTDGEEDLHRLGEFLAGLTNLKALDVLPYHTMGKAKYERLGLEYPLGDTPAADKELAVWAKDVIMQGIKDKLRSRQED
ncbi:MAG: pyruvate formate lyase-activating protein [Ruminococcus sp.]|nr:pyruvate formate lyase-activating protein [Ruminococcus sp.]